MEGDTKSMITKEITDLTVVKDGRHWSVVVKVVVTFVQ